MYKRVILSLFIIFLFAASISCAANTQDQPTQQSVESSQSLSETETAIPGPDLPAYDFNGEDFTFIVRGNEAGDWGNYDICAVETTGEPVNDAVFARNLKMSEIYNVTIAEYRTGDVLSAAKKSMNAQDGVFDALFTSFWDASVLTAGGYLLDLNSVPYIDLSQPWWDQRANTDLSILNKLMFTVNDISIVAAESTIDVYLFNKQMIIDLNLDNPYQLVKDGKWTIDKMMSMMKGVAYDLDGDGKMNGNDKWGMVNNSGGVINSVFMSANQKYVQKDADDVPYLAINNEKAISAFEKTIMLMYQNSDVLDDAGVMDQVFQKGNSLFHNQCLQIVKRFRQMDIDFGLLPNPKFDENMTEYYQGVHPIGSAFSIPVTCTGESLDAAGIIIEALAAESRISLIPAYYDVNLTYKLLRDEDSAVMLDIILSSRSYDLLRPYNWGGLEGAVGDLVKKGNIEFASAYEKLEPSINAAIEKTVDAIQDIKPS